MTKLKDRNGSKRISRDAELYRAIVGNTAIGLAVLDRRGIIVDTNPAFCRMLGRTEAELLGSSVGDITFPPDRAKSKRSIMKLWEKKIKNFSMDKRYVRKDGSVFWGHLEAALVENSRKEPQYAYAIISDIDSQKKALENLEKINKRYELLEQSLRRSKNQYRSLLMNSPDVVWTTDEFGHSTFMSPNLKRVYGYTAKEIYADGAKLWLGRIHPEDRNRVTKAFTDLFESGRPFDVKYRIRRKDGVWIWLHDRSTKTYMREGKRFADGAFRDITERKAAAEELKKSREQIVRADRMAALGTLGAGAAHELNNPLSGVLGLTQILLRDTPIGDKKRPYLLEMERELNRCTKIVRDLLEFSRDEPEKSELTELSCPEIIAKALALIKYQLREPGIKVTQRYAPNLPKVYGNEHLLEQVFVNILTNARDAAGAHGATIRIAAARGNGDVRIKITDAGEGIAPEHIGKIFDPFFTTKAPGKGTGLGLAVSYKILKQHCGRLEVESAPGKGATFTVVLHAVRDAAS